MDWNMEQPTQLLFLCIVSSGLPSFLPEDPVVGSWTGLE